MMQFTVDYKAVQVFSTGRLYFQPPEELPDTVEFRAEAVQLRSANGFSFLADDNDVYIAGRSTLFRIRGVYAATMDLTLYDPSCRMPIWRDETGHELLPDFLRAANGELTRQKKVWGDPTSSSDRVYKFQGGLDDPRGFVKLEFQAAAGCTIRFDTEACVSAAEMRDEMRRDPWAFLREAWR